MIMAMITVVIETPRHSIGKYNFNEKEQCYHLKKILPLGMVFPYDFGMIKETRGEDGGPLDAMVITECNTYPGVQMTCRVIGALLAKQTQHGKETIRNDRFFFIPEDSLVYEHIRDIKDFSKKHNRQLEDFLSTTIKRKVKNFSL